MKVINLDTIEEIHRANQPEEIPGHPVNTFKLENREIERLINERTKPHLEVFKNDDRQEISLFNIRLTIIRELFLAPFMGFDCDSRGIDANVKKVGLG